MRAPTGIARWICVTALLAATEAASAPVETFPARFANHERVVAVAVFTGHGITRREVRRTSNDDVLVIDDESRFHLEDADPQDPPIAATWRSVSARRIEFTLTPEAVAGLEAELRAGLPFSPTIRFGVGRVRFSRNGSRYAGTQVVRVRGRYRGFTVHVVETMHLSGERLPEVFSERDRPR